MTKFINKQGTTIQDLIDAGFPLDRPLQFVDPDTEYLLIPHFLLDEEVIAIMSDYGSKWKRPTK